MIKMEVSNNDQIQSLALWGSNSKAQWYPNNEGEEHSDKYVFNIYMTNEIMPTIYQIVWKQLGFYATELNVYDDYNHTIAHGVCTC